MSLLQRLYDVQGGLCAGCGQPMLALSLRKTIVADPLSFPSVDHVTPRCKGGRDDRTNIVAMHLRCNNLKADRDPTGCEMIWREAVSAQLCAEYSLVMEAISGEARRATLGDLWPQLA